MLHAQRDTRTHGRTHAQRDCTHANVLLCSSAPLLHPTSLADMISTPDWRACAVEVVLADIDETTMYIMMDTCGPGNAAFCQLKCWVDY